MILREADTTWDDTAFSVEKGSQGAPRADIVEAVETICGERKTELLNLIKVVSKGTLVEA